MPFFGSKSSGNSASIAENQRRLAELEQSEAILKCQLLNVEEQLEKTKADLDFSKQQNDNLSEQCKKLQDCLEKLDEEKASLTEIKFENQKLRKNIEKAENESLEIVKKLAELTQKNADLQHENSQIEYKNHQLSECGSSYKEIMLENERLKEECYSVGESRLALEDVKECLAERCSHLESEITSESCKYDDLNSQLRMITDEKADMEEKVEELKMERELHSTMQENLIQQIEQLQDQVESLKVKLQDKTLKAESVDIVSQSLNQVQKEKEQLQMKCMKQKETVESLKNEIECARVQYESNNLSLMQDTNKLAEELRIIKVENEKLHHELSLSQIENELNEKFRTNLTQLLQNNESILASDYKCESMLNEIVSTVDEGVDEFTRASNEEFFSHCKANIKNGIFIVESVRQFKKISDLYDEAVEKSKHQISKLNEDENVML